MKRIFKFKEFFLFGLLFTSPILSLAEVEPNLIKNPKVEASQLNLKTSLDSEKLNLLLKEGAISKKDAKRYLHNESSDLPLSINPNKFKTDTTENVSRKNINNNLTSLDYSETESLIKIKFDNIKKAKKHRVIKTNSGWQIILQLANIQDIDLSSTPKDTNYISNIHLTKFDDYTYIIKIVDNQEYKTNKPILKENSDLEIEINFTANKTLDTRRLRFPFFNRFNKKNKTTFNPDIAIAPPLGDIAVGSVVLQNRGFIQLEGPNVSLTLNNTSAKDALMRLSKLGQYGIVLVSNNEDSQTSSLNSIDDSPKVTLSFANEDYSLAFNSVLLASGLQAKRSNNLIIVGKNVLGKSFGPQISKVYRLNQASASAAADYLATLGASIAKVDTLSSSTSSTEQQNSSETFKYIDSYSSTTGPLKGLIGTTDSRLQSITLVGSSELIQIAEKYLKQLDLRQRQVALSVKILDVDLSNNDSLNNNFSLLTGTTFIVNDRGKLTSAFGNYLPPSITDPTNVAVTKNPGLSFPANELYNLLTAQITSSSTKVLANPTLILSESAEKIQGGAEVVGKTGSNQATIGRQYGNESFVTLGKNVITDYETSTSEEGGSTTCKAQFSTAGLTFGARINKIDDNGYVTFSLSPALTEVQEIQTIPGCGDINILSITRLDTGNLRVKDSQTLILTGVINDLKSKSISKIPIFGDIPILGRLFRSTSEAKRKSELIILVTPKIINDSETNTLGIGYTPSVKETKELIDSKND